MIKEAYEERLSCAVARFLICYGLSNREGDTQGMWLESMMEAYQLTGILTEKQFLHTLCNMANAQAVSKADFHQIYDRICIGNCE